LIDAFELGGIRDFGCSVFDFVAPAPEDLDAGALHDEEVGSLAWSAS